MDWLGSDHVGTPTHARNNRKAVSSVGPCRRITSGTKFKDPKFPQNLRPISLLPIIGKPFKKVILKAVQRHTEERSLLNACQFGFRAHHSMTLQCMRLTDHVTLNFNNKMSTAAVFLDSEKVFDATWHLGLLYKLYNLKRDRKEGYVLRKLQRGLSAIGTWCERWNIRINEDNTPAIYFSQRLGPLRLILH
jgi:hypothetical protein